MLQVENPIRKYAVKKRAERNRRVFVRRFARSPVFVVLSCSESPSVATKKPVPAGRSLSGAVCSRRRVDVCFLAKGVA